MMDEQEKKDVAELNKDFEEAGVEIEVTGRVHWKPGDEITNNAHAMIHNDWERELGRVAPKLANLYIRDHVGFMKEMDAYNELLGRMG